MYATLAGGLIVALVMFNNSPKTASPPPIVLSGSGVQKTGIVTKLNHQNSPRIWVLHTQNEWKAFRETAVWNKPKEIAESTVDFNRNKIVVVRNTNYFNPMSLIKTNFNHNQTKLTVTIGETRSARPLKREFHFVAFVLARKTTTISDGSVTIASKKLTTDDIQLLE